jgi:CheY-like chemotaxis protein
LEATRRIRSSRYTGATERTKSFTLTGLASEETSKEAEIAGVDLFLPKPFKFAKLKELSV